MNSPRVILVVEDQPDEVELLLLAVGKAELDVEVRHVSDGELALSYLKGIPPYDDRDRFPMPSLVLLDVKLPLRSGFEVLKWIKRESDLSHLPVIIFSSSRDPNDIEKAYKLGANAYLCKPPEFKTLVEMIKSLGSFWMNFSTPAPSARPPADETQNAYVPDVKAGPKRESLP